MPRYSFPEYAFIGRSNVGKSTLINCLLGRKKLAHVSNTPGKTQLINVYEVNQGWALVDLPGYGYAKISKKQRAKWKKMTEGYLTKRPNLACVMLLIDSRISPQKIDLDFANWMGENAIPFIIIYTKSDKVKEDQLQVNLDLFREKILFTWDSLPLEIVTSSISMVGRNEVLNFIEATNNI